MGDALTNWLARPAERSGTCIERIVRTVDNGRSQRVKCDLAVQDVTEELFNILPLCPHGIFPPVRAVDITHILLDTSSNCVLYAGRCFQSSQSIQICFVRMRNSVHAQYSPSDAKFT